MNFPHPLQVHANGLDHRVLEWRPDAPRETAVLLHGYMDAGGTWDLVAPALVAAGFRVLAPDLRGYGGGARISEGAYYYFTDYVFDLADLIDALVPQGAVYLIGHSMGGTLATLYAGTFPERVKRVALLEGFGPPDSPHEAAPDRVRHWIDGVRAVRKRQAAPKEPMAFEQALARLKMAHPKVDRAVLASRLPHLTRKTEDGRVEWLYDPLHKTASPAPFFAKSYRAFATKVTAPALFVVGGPDGYHPPDEAERLAAFPCGERVELADSGHMMHWTHPAEVSRELLRFWTDSPGAGTR